jgi:Peptidase A4 family
MIRRTTTLLTTLAALLACAAPVEADNAAHRASSVNWAGYAVSSPGVRFRRVASTWVQPGATCAAGERRYSAYWVGIGGFHSTAKALEQIGTQANCSSKGEAFYSAWYELVPAASVHIPLAVHPGDTLSASVTVSRKRVKLYLANRTTGKVFATQLRAKHIDRTAAEWIAEAPSTCDHGGCHPLPLANFGAMSFAGARATDTAGHGGPIADPSWSPTAIALSPDPGLDIGAGFDTGGALGGATPSGLSAGGDAFTVTYQEAPLPAPATPEPQPEPSPPPPPPVAPVALVALP